MRKVIVLEHISIDGVIQAPGGPDEDTSGVLRVSTLPPAGTACCACAALCNSHHDYLDINNPAGRRRGDS